MKRKIYTLASVFALSLAGFTAAAQQLPNVGFNDWKTENGVTVLTASTSDGSQTRPGAEPEGWNASNINQFLDVITVKKGDEENPFVALENCSILSNVVPAYLTIGTPWVFAYGSGLQMSSYASIGDGGSCGGVDFTNKPDALYFKIRHTAAEGEVAHVIAYTWKGTFKSNVPLTATRTGNVISGYTYSISEWTSLDNVDRAVLGLEDADKVTASGQLIAKMDYVINEDYADWKEFKIDFEYVDGESEPEKLNVIFSAGDYWTRANLKDKSHLDVDDVKLIYHSRLESLALDGVTGFDKGVYNYNVDLKTLPTKEEVLAAATADGKSATVDATIDETAMTVTITVTNVDADEDGQSTHTYTLQYKKAVVTDYPGYLNITLTSEGVTGSVALNQGPVTVKISDYGDGTCDFLLPDLTVLMSLGDIAVDNVIVTEDNGVKTYNGSVQNMELADGNIHANVIVGGTIDANGKANLKIDVTWIGGFTGQQDVPIGVTFTTDKVQTEAEGYIHVKKGDAWLAEKLAANLTITPGLDDSLTPDYEITLSGVTFVDDETTVDLGDITVHATAVDESGETYTYGSEEAEVQLGNGKTASVSMTGTYDPATGLYNVSFTVTVDGETYVFGFTTEAIGASVTDAVKSATLVYGATGVIVVDGYTGDVAVYTADGRLAARTSVDGRAEIAVAKGLYVVRTDSKAQKVAVK